MHIKILAVAAIFLAVPASVCADNFVRQPSIAERGSRMTTYRVATVAQFNTALASAKSGDVIELAAGEYSALSIRNFNPIGNVTIRSADADNPAHISDLYVQNSSNLTFTELDIGRPLNTGETAAAVKFARFDNVDNLTIDRVHVYGSLDDNPQNDGRGMEIKNSSNVVLSNSEFEQVILALAIASCQDVTLVGNSFHDIRSDGINVMATDRITIDSNHFTNFDKIVGSDHSDAIQFWTTNQDRTSTDIVIRNNQMIQGTGTAFQGIFLRDDSTTMPFQRVTIENNLVYMMDMPNGIMVKVAQDVTIANNTVISPQNDGKVEWIRLEMVTGGTVTGNVTETFYDSANVNVTYTNNILLKNSAENQALIVDLNAGPLALIANLLISGFGYQFAGVGSAIWLPVVSPVTPEPPAVEEEVGEVTPDPVPQPDPVPEEEVATGDPDPVPMPTPEEEIATSDPDPVPPPAPAPEEVVSSEPEPTPTPAPVEEEVATTDPDPAPVTDPVPEEEVAVTDPLPDPAPAPVEEVAVVEPTPAPAPVETTPGNGNGGSKRSAVVEAKPVKMNSSGKFALATLGDSLTPTAANDPFAVAAAATSDGSASVYRPSYDYALVSNG
jgi:hypothetical protein